MDTALGVPRSAAGPNRSMLFGLISAVTGLCATMLAVAVPASAATPSSTTVTPAGDSFSATLASDTTADFVVGNMTVSCPMSATSGQVPAAPGNHDDAGPVTMSIAPPTFTNGGSSCPTNVFFVDATSTSSGPWSISLQFVPAVNPGDPPSATGTLTIPPGGVVTTTSGIVCTVTVAPDHSAQVSGTLTPADGTNPPLLTISDASIPISVSTGFGCPSSETTASFSATYQLLDTTHPDQDLDITA